MSIEAMKQALEALQQTTLEDRLVQIGPLDWEYQGTLAVNALRKAIAEAEKREWVSLTVDEINKFMPYCHSDHDLSEFRTFAFELEAKLKEKNGQVMVTYGQRHNFAA